MSNDIKIVDYIPEDHILCLRCKNFEICPFDYACESLIRCEEDEEKEEL